MLRHLFTVFFILASLSTQASVAYACAMKAGTQVVHAQCCCEPDEAQAPSQELAEAAGGAGCCQRVIDVPDGAGDQVGGLNAGTKLPDYQPQTLPPVLAPVLFSFVQLQQVDEPAWERLPGDGRYGTDLYLRTLRLRL